LDFEKNVKNVFSNICNTHGSLSSFMCRLKYQQAQESKLKLKILYIQYQSSIGTKVVTDLQMVQNAPNAAGSHDT